MHAARHQQWPPPATRHGAHCRPDEAPPLPTGPCAPRSKPTWHAADTGGTHLVESLQHGVELAALAHAVRRMAVGAQRGRNSRQRRHHRRRPELPYRPLRQRHGQRKTGGHGLRPSRGDGPFRRPGGSPIHCGCGRRRCCWRGCCCCRRRRCCCVGRRTGSGTLLPRRAAR